MAQASTSGVPEAIKGLPEAQQQNILGLAQRANADVNNPDALNVLIKASETQTQVGQDLTGQEIWDRTHDYLKLSGASTDQIAQIQDNFAQNGVVKFDKSYWSNPAPDANAATARTEAFLGFRSVDSTIIGTGKVLTEFGEFVESNPVAKYSLMALDVASGPALFAVRQMPIVEVALGKANAFVARKFEEGFAEAGRMESDTLAGGVGGVAALSVGANGFLGAAKGLKSFISDFKFSRAEQTIQNAAHAVPYANLSPNVNWAHVFEGEIRSSNKRGTYAVGFHQETPHAKSYARVVDDSRTPVDKHGIYEAKIEVRNPETGEWIPKKSSTFFPKEWTPERLNAEVMSAFENKTWKDADAVAGMPRTWIGISPSGVEMKGHFLNEKIDTVYPIFNGKK